MITNKFKQYLSEHVPRKISNIIFQIFNGIQAVLQHFEYMMELNKRESNILTAQYKSSLRNLASMNGYEPRLKTSSTGILRLKFAPKLFQRTGYPLYIKPYTVFKNKLTKAEYIYNSDVPIRITDNNVLVPVIEGVLTTDNSNFGNGETIQRIYLPDNIAEGSIMIESDSKPFREVKSFVDNVGMYDDRQFIIKYSKNPKNPIIVYIKGVTTNSQIAITFILSNGSYGNMTKRNYFDCEGIVDKYGSVISFADDELTITNDSGFKFGSDGSDENDLRSAIGYNHGISILFDNISYRNFLNRFSTILVQNILVHRLSKQINNIYLWKRCYCETFDVVNSYKRIIQNAEYKLTQSEKNAIDSIISENEYCLSSHTLNDAKTRKFVVQILFFNLSDMKAYQAQIQNLIYLEFSKFLYIRNHTFNVEQFIAKFQEENKIKIQYKLFSEDGKHDDKVVTHNNGYDEFGKRYVEFDDNTFLPILKGDFQIKQNQYGSSGYVHSGNYGPDQSYQFNSDIVFGVLETNRTNR